MAAELNTKGESMKKDKSINELLVEFVLSDGGKSINSWMVEMANWKVHKLKNVLKRKKAIVSQIIAARILLNAVKGIKGQRKD